MGGPSHQVLTVGMHPPSVPPSSYHTSRLPDDQQMLGSQWAPVIRLQKGTAGRRGGRSRGGEGQLERVGFIGD